MLNMPRQKSALGAGEGKDKPKGVNAQAEKDCAYLALTDWHIQGHCLEL